MRFPAQMQRNGPLRPLTVWLAILASALGSCQENAPVPTLSEDESYLGADGVVMGGITTITNDEGIRSARLHFDTAYQWSDSVHQSLRGVDLMVFNEDGSERARITSLRGTFDPRGESLTANGEVVLLVPFQDRRLTTEELHYDPEIAQLWSDSAFVMTQAGNTYEGTSFSSDLEFGDFVVYGTAGSGR